MASETEIKEIETAVTTNSAIRSLQARRKTKVDVFDVVKVDEFSAGDLIIEFLPSVASSRLQLKKMIDGEKSEEWEARAESVEDFLYATLYSINIGGDDVPVTKKAIAEFGGEFQGWIFQAIFSTFDTGNKNGSTSTSTSSVDQPLKG